MQPSEELAQRLLLACADLTRAVTATATGTRLSLTQARVLAHLERHGPLRVSRLAELEHCAQPSMTGLLGRLDTAGHTTRRPDPEDARAVLVAVTPGGREELAHHRVLLRGPLADAVADLDPAAVGDLEHLTHLVEDLAGSVRAGGARSL
jgi:DNA-binding MarR family transcriptional regulator